MLQSLLMLLLLATGIAGLCACGKKGPLYLPEGTPPPAAETATPAPPPVPKE
jgi:predicted small lipoprotein YifL